MDGKGLILISKPETILYLQSKNQLPGVNVEDSGVRCQVSGKSIDAET